MRILKIKKARRKSMHKGRFVWQSIIVWMCFVAPVYGKVRGFEEISQKKYEQDVWHTYAHKKSGLEVIWIENDDVNKAFTIGVKTPTTNDTGVNHIIEHTVFTGSKAYPSPSVFFDASEAYPNTYMNALTSGDMTIFPFSTPYLSCYQKLCPIYLDAVFRPQFLETPYGFYEESFHVVPEEGRCGGVVYNEMKGAYGNADRGLYRALRQTIYANTPYAFDSGGAPNDIPTLTYETFIETYKQYYYPGNMKIILYGDLPVEEVLEQILPYVEKQEKKEGVSLKVNQLHDTASFEYAVLEDQDKGVLIKAFALNDGVGAEALQTLDLWMSAYLMSPKMYLESKLRETGIQIRWLRDTDLPQPIYALAAVNIPLDKMEETSKKIDEVIEEALKLGGRNVFLEQDILKEAIIEAFILHKVY